MSNNYDGPAKELMALNPEAWARLTHFIPPNATVITHDATMALSSVSVDKFFEIREADKIWYLVLEFQSQANYDFLIPCNYRDLIIRNSKGRKVEVKTAVIYSHPGALPQEQETGIVEFPCGDGQSNTFNFKVIKVWELSPQELVDGGIATAALAPLGKINDLEIPDLLQQIQLKIADEPIEKKNQFWGSMGLLLGLKYGEEEIEFLMKGIGSMENSSIYQRAIRQGREIESVEKGQKHLQTVLNKLHPNHPESLKDLVRTVTSSDKLDKAFEEALTANSWEAVRDFLAQE